MNSIGKFNIQAELPLVPESKQPYPVHRIANPQSFITAFLFAAIMNLKKSGLFISICIAVF